MYKFEIIPKKDSKVLMYDDVLYRLGRLIQSIGISSTTPATEC